MACCSTARCRRMLNPGGEGYSLRYVLGQMRNGTACQLTLLKSVIPRDSPGSFDKQWRAALAEDRESSYMIITSRSLL